MHSNLEGYKQQWRPHTSDTRGKGGRFEGRERGRKGGKGTRLMQNQKTCMLSSPSVTIIGDSQIMCLTSFTPIAYPTVRAVAGEGEAERPTRAPLAVVVDAGIRLIKDGAPLWHVPPARGLRWCDVNTIHNDFLHATFKAKKDGSSQKWRSLNKMERKML